MRKPRLENVVRRRGRRSSESNDYINGLLLRVRLGADFKLRSSAGSLRESCYERTNHCRAKLIEITIVINGVGSQRPFAFQLGRISRCQSGDCERAHPILLSFVDGKLIVNAPSRGISRTGFGEVRVYVASMRVGPAHSFDRLVDFVAARGITGSQ